MRFLAVVALLAALAACQPLPHPFADSAPPPDSPLMTPPDSAGVVVEAVSGAPKETAQDLADAMATALQDNDVPASTDARNSKSYVLKGKATANDAGNGKLRVTVAWEMHNPDGSLTGTASRDRDDDAIGLGRCRRRHRRSGRSGRAEFRQADRKQGAAARPRPTIR